MATAFPERAQVVVIGGGIVGCSVAYHLTKLGVSDVVVLEQGRLSCGTTWHAAGLVGQLRAQESMTRLMKYSTELYARLESETGLATGWKECGSIQVARTPQRMEYIKRSVASARAYGVEAELISPREAGQRWPVMATGDLVGAVWLPGDGKANPTDLTQSLAKGARQGGAKVVEGVKVTGITVVDGVARGVRTDQGDIDCETVVVAAGQWSKKVGAMAGVTVPLHSAEHYYIVTEQIPGVHRDLPVLRDPDGYVYFKEEVGGLVMGGFEPDAKPWVGPHDIPEPFEFALLDEDWDQFAILMENAIIRVPALETAGVVKFYNGPESFTPDGAFLLGEAPEVRNLYLGCGFNSAGIASAGGAGLALAEWIVAGEPERDLSSVDVRRFAKFHDNETWLRERVKEALGLHYVMPWPNKELESARPLRRSPIYHLLEERGAVFGTKMGWERANYFDLEYGGTGTPTPVEYSFGRQNWFGCAAEEQRAARERVAIFDQTSFSKYVLKGRDAEAVLDYLCTADMAVPVGRAVYTGMLNERGGYESDFTATRIGAEEYLIVTGSAQTTRDFAFIERRLPPDARVALVDVTSAYAVLGVMGPAARRLLESVSKADFSNAAFPFGASRMVDVGYATVRATRITYVGELGWELYIPAEFAVGVYETLRAAGDAFGVADGGYYAIEAMRVEKAYRAWGRELTPDCDPVEAGLVFACKLGTDRDFRGRAAVEKARAEGVGRKLVSFVLADPEPVLWGSELILRDGEPVGSLTSGTYGATLGASVGMGYVSRGPEASRTSNASQISHASRTSRGGGTVDAEWLRAGRYEIEVAGTRHAAVLHLRAPYDPGAARTKA
ncbi:MAG: FAD-dependent oxidoreductase [Catenulispora sp.]|nr:FAD-dependent oxidoreductase [Catenulispora sp.]